MGYAGFTSDIGELSFDAPPKWAAYEFVFHAGSEHTVNGKKWLEIRYGTPSLSSSTS